MNPLEEEIHRLKKLLFEREEELKASQQESQRWYKAYCAASVEKREKV